MSDLFGIDPHANEALRAGAIQSRSDGRSGFIGNNVDKAKAYLLKYPSPAPSHYGGSPDYDWFRADAVVNPGKYGSNLFQDVLDTVVAAPLTYAQEQAQKQGEAVNILVKSAVQTAGKALGTVSDLNDTILKSYKEMGDLASRAPVVGAPIHGVITIVSGPFALTSAIAHGESIDQAVLDNFKQAIKGVAEVAPLARTVISFVPGIGSTVNAAIAAALALAEGASITDALMQAAKNAIPGGPLAAAALDVAYHAAQGDNILDASLAASMRMLPPEAQKALVLVQRAAHGDNIPLAVMEEARDLVPDYAKAALNVGIAIGHGKRLQDIALDAVHDITAEGLNIIVDQGKTIISNSPIYAAAKNVLEQPQKIGYNLGVGLLSNSGLTAENIVAFRDKLNDLQKAGFDLAMAAHAGQVVSVAPPGLSDQAKAAYYVARGLVGADSNLKASMVQMIVDKSPLEGRVGIQVAIDKVNQLKNSIGTKVNAVISPVINLPVVKPAVQYVVKPVGQVAANLLRPVGYVVNSVATGYDKAADTVAHTANKYVQNVRTFFNV